MSKNAEGWIRHRGGKCPVEAGTEVSTRHRDGKIVDVHHMTAYEDASAASLKCVWSHRNDADDIMAYKLHKPAEQVEPFIEAVQAFNALAKVQQLDGPIGWRDRITEIDATTQALTTERAELVQKLASEGFALIGRINELLTDAAQKHEDMSDFRNWKVGDLVQVIDPESSGLLAGKAYPISELEEEIEEEDEIHGLPCLLADGDTWLYAKNMRWHSRPSA